ncbi:MAG: hypothetical protein AAF399_08960 [Bacteroidota bacterium]
MTDLIKYGLAGILILFFQLFLFNDLELFGIATPFVFLTFLIMLPVNSPFPLQLALAFVIGLVMDLAAGPPALGLHAFSCVLLIGARHLLLPLITPTQVRSVEDIQMGNQTFIWYIGLFLPLIFLHHLAYFFLEDFSFRFFFSTFWKVISSTIYTFLVSMLLVQLFYRK